MRFEAFLGSVGTEVIWQFIGSGFALVWAGTTAALALQGKRMPAVRLVLGAVFGALVLFGLGQIAVLSWPASTASALRLAAMTHAVVNLTGPLSLGPVVAVTLPVCALMGAGTGPLRSKRQAGKTAAVLVLASLVTASVVGGGYGSSNLIYPMFRAVVYLIAGVLVAAAVSSGPPAEPAQRNEGAEEASVAAACLFPLLVAVGEASGRGLVHLLLVLQAIAIPPGKWGIGLAQMLGHTGYEWAGSFVALGLAGAVAWLPVVMAGRWRPAWAATALLACGVAGLVLVGSDLGPDRLLALELIRSPSAQTGGSPLPAQAPAPLP